MSEWTFLHLYFSNFIENTTNQIDNINKTSHEKIFYHKNIENKISTLKFDSDLILVLNSVYNGIKNIYTSYFYYEMNKFNDIDMRIFQNLTALEELDLSDNSISIIRKTDLKKLETLSKVDFSGNPIAKKNSISAQIKEMFTEDCRVILNKNLFN